MTIIEFLYALCVVLLSVYGFNSLVLTWLYLRHRHDPRPAPPPPNRCEKWIASRWMNSV